MESYERNIKSKDILLTFIADFS